ncbi:hypothetical protein ACA910_006517 [Epithemia clementina (nom. ined.)]
MRRSSTSIPSALYGPQNTGSLEEISSRALAATANTLWNRNCAIGNSGFGEFSLGARLAGQHFAPYPAVLFQGAPNVAVPHNINLQAPQRQTSETPTSETPIYNVLSSSITTLLEAAPYLEVPSAALGGSGHALHRLFSQMTGPPRIAELIDIAAASIIRLPSAPSSTNVTGVVLGAPSLFPIEAGVQTRRTVFPEDSRPLLRAIYPVDASAAAAAASLGRSQMNPAPFKNPLHMAATATDHPSPTDNGSDSSNLYTTAAQSELTDSGNASIVSRKKRQYTHANFAQKLHQIVTLLEEEDKEHVATFMDEGGVWVRDKGIFVKEIMPMYCRGQGWSSFRRQLFSYQFSALPPCRGLKGAYKNPLFLRGRPELCAKIKRNDKHDKVNRRLRNGQPG